MRTTYFLTVLSQLVQVIDAHIITVVGGPDNSITKILQARPLTLGDGGRGAKMWFDSTLVRIFNSILNRCFLYVEVAGATCSSNKSLDLGDRGASGIKEFLSRRRCNAICKRWCNLQWSTCKESYDSWASYIRCLRRLEISHSNNWSRCLTSRRVGEGESEPLSGLNVSTFKT